MSEGSRDDSPPAGESAGQIAELYLGNILYALERCALSLEQEDRRMDAAFYRGIGRKLAEAYGKRNQSRGPSQPQNHSD